jgi:hypothetical protein
MAAACAAEQESPHPEHEKANQQGNYCCSQIVYAVRQSMPWRISCVRQALLVSYQQWSAMTPGQLTYVQAVL